MTEEWQNSLRNKILFTFWNLFGTSRNTINYKATKWPNLLSDTPKRTFCQLTAAQILRPLITKRLRFPQWSRFHKFILKCLKPKQNELITPIIMLTPVIILIRMMMFPKTLILQVSRLYNTTTRVKSVTMKTLHPRAQPSLGRKSIGVIARGKAITINEKSNYLF